MPSRLMFSSEWPFTSSEAGLIIEFCYRTRSAMAAFYVDGPARQAIKKPRLRGAFSSGVDARGRLTALFLVIFMLTVTACTEEHLVGAAPEETTGHIKPQPTIGSPEPQPPAPGQPADPTPSPSATGDGVLTPGQAKDFETFRQDCEKGVPQWREGQVDYPSKISIRVHEPTTFNAAVDLRDDLLPPDKVIDAQNGELVGEPIAVKCRLAAQLIPVGDHIKVDPASAGNWDLREFSPSGVVEWSWSVSVDKPVDQQLRLILVPAVLIEGGNYAYNRQNEASLTTTVAVEATLIEAISYWFETQWTLLAGIAVVLAAAIVAGRRWIQEQIKELKSPRRKRRTGNPAPR